MRDMRRTNKLEVLDVDTKKSILENLQVQSNLLQWSQDKALRLKKVLETTKSREKKMQAAAQLALLVEMFGVINKKEDKKDGTKQ